LHAEVPTMAQTKILGFMRPVGGGDPVPLRKTEVIVGRRRSCDIRLDFENVSGRHCILTYTNGTWHIRDLNSTNGTKVNGAKVEREQGLMPDDEVAISTHFFTIDYEPAGAFAESQQALEEETGHAKRTSLMELAGIDGESDAPPVTNHRPAPFADRASVAAAPPVPSNAAEFTLNLDDDPEAEFVADVPQIDEDEFLRLIEEDMKGKS
jgi:predicted component of type VI protein secretion system